MEQLRTLTINSILKRLLINRRSRIDVVDENRTDELPLPPAILMTIDRKLRSVIEWLRKHDRLIRDSTRFVDELVWYRGGDIDDEEGGVGFGGGWSSTRIDRSATISNILHRRREDLNAGERFELASVYCLERETIRIWPELDRDQQQKYLAERIHQHDPIVVYWTGVCARQPWLSDSYLVRAFYWAAEHDHAEALEHFWEHIVQERADAVAFRAVRAFQLAACRGHLTSLLFLWKVTDEEQHRMMIQGTLTYTQGALYAFESACKEGQYDLVRFIFQEADYQQRAVILGAEECRAFRLAAENGHLDVLKLFLEKSTRMNLKRNLLEAENCYAFRRAIVNGHESVVELIWNSIDEEDQRRLMLNALLFSGGDLNEMAINTTMKRSRAASASRMMGFLWKNSPVDSRSALFSQYVAPKMSKKFYDRSSTTKDDGASSTTSPRGSVMMVGLNELNSTIESTFFDICAMDTLDDVIKFVENKLTFEYGRSGR